MTINVTNNLTSKGGISVFLQFLIEARLCFLRDAANWMQHARRQCCFQPHRPICKGEKL